MMVGIRDLQTSGFHDDDDDDADGPVELFVSPKHLVMTLAPKVLPKTQVLLLTKQST